MDRRYINIRRVREVYTFLTKRRYNGKILRERVRRKELFKKSLLVLSIGLFIIGCGGGGTSTSDVNRFKSENSLGFYGDIVLFANKTVTGVWAQYEYENGSVKNSVAFKHRFNNEGKRELQIPLLGETWYPIGEYGVNNNGDKIFFNDSNSTRSSYEYMEDTSEENCIKVNEFKNVDTNKTFSNTYQLCKEI